MAGCYPAKRLIFSSFCRFITNQVGIGTAKARRPDRLMGVDHDMVPGRLGDCIQVMVNHELAVVIISPRNDVAAVSAFDGFIAIAVHQGIGGFHIPLIIPDGGSRFMVHHQADACRVGIGIDGIDIEVRIGRLEVIDEVFGIAVPVFPALVPTFHQHGVEAMFRGKVDIAFDILRMRAVAWIPLRMGIIALPYRHGAEILGIMPVSAAGNHFPPDTDVLDGMDPGDVVVGAGLVEVEHQAALEKFRRGTRDLDGPPRGRTRGLEMTFPPFRIGRQEGLQGLSGDFQMHAGIVLQGGFMQGDIVPGLVFQQQGGLDADNIFQRCIDMAVYPVPEDIRNA